MPTNYQTAEKRTASILAAIANGITDPQEIANAERCTRELILHYARLCPSIVVQQVKPAPKMRRRAVFSLAQEVPA